VLENAVQYGAGAPITVTLSVSSAELSIVVRDRGPGIASADLPHLFDRFYRGRDAKRRTTGTGMGLAIRARHAGRRGGPHLGGESAPAAAHSSRLSCRRKRQPAMAAEHAL
jgi:signal transduction histidine kinase